MLDRQNIVTPIGLQILNQVEFMEAASVEHVEKVISQLIIEG
jgi:hypothetical protein